MKTPSPFNPLRLAAYLVSLIALSLAIVSCASGPDQRRADGLLAALDPAKPFAESAFIDSEGLSIHYRAWKPEGPTRGRILLLHGFGSSSFSYRFLVPELIDAGWEVAAADIPPFGYSDKSDAVALLGYKRGSLLWAVPDALGWEGPIVLLGHSMGGLYISAMALQEPTRVDSLIYLAGAVPVDEKSRNRAPSVPGIFSGILESSLRDWKQVRKTLANFSGEPVPAEMVDGYYLPFQQKGGVKALLAWSKQSAKQGPVNPRLIDKPSLLIWGEKDSIVSLRTAEGEKIRLRGLHPPF